MATPGDDPIRRHDRRVTLADRWSPSDNGITALRFMLAAGVFVAHAFTLSGLPDPAHQLTGGQVFGGTIAVSAFFALSGFLLVQSRERQRVHRFVTNRALRILPGYWVSIVVVGLVIVPAVAVAAGATITPRDGLDYVLANAGVVVVRDTIGQVFAGNPASASVNGSLWTLAPEIACYIVLAIVPVRFMRIGIPAITVTIAALHVSNGGGTNLHDLLLSFGLGASAAIGRRWLPMHGGVGFALLAVLAVASAVGAYRLAAPFVVSYLALWAAISLPLRWTHDLSFGVYIYAYPVQQSVVLLGLGFMPGMTVAGIATLALAAFSWFLVERPALRFRASRRRPIETSQLRAPALQEGTVAP